MARLNDNVKLFIELYNTLDDLLRERYKETSRNFSVITKYSHQLEKSYSLINQKKARKLDMIRILRNDLVHEFDLNAEHLIYISDETIEFLKDEIENLAHPITAYSICTKIENLYSVTKDDKVIDALKVMRTHGHTQMPIFNNKRLVGVFSPNVIFSYLAKHGLNKDKPLYISDLLEFLPCDKHVSEKYAFIGREANIDDVFELFDDSHRENKKIVAIFVTENGLNTESVLGMIVPYDLLKNR